MWCAHTLGMVKSLMMRIGFDCLMILQQKKAKHKSTPTPTPDSSTEKPAKKSKAKAKAKASEDAQDDEGGKGKGKAKKPRKKKDKNEPKRGLSAFMFFSQANREKVCLHLLYICVTLDRHHLSGGLRRETHLLAGLF